MNVHPLEIPEDLKKKLEELKVKLEKFKDKITEKFKQYILGIALMPPDRMLPPALRRFKEDEEE